MRVCRPTRLHIESADTEHELLAACVDEMYQRWKTGAGAQRLQYLVRDLELIGYEHFRNEEAMMRAVDYPFLDSHAEAHHKLLGILQHIRIDHQLGHLEFNDDVISLIAEWVTDHIHTMDARFARFSRKQDRAGANKKAGSASARLDL